MIKQAIIPIAGLGSRMLPATKTINKALLPVFDRPVIQHIAQEAIDAGIQHLIFVIGEKDQSVEEYFRFDPQLDTELKKRGKTALAQELSQLSSAAEYTFVTQKNPNGDGGAILAAKSFLDHQSPTLVLFGDELIFNPSGPNAIEQLLVAHQSAPAHWIASQVVAEEETSRYGIVEGEFSAENWATVERLLEKPLSSETPSRHAILGKYVLQPSIWTVLEKLQTQNPTPVEIGLSQALTQALKNQDLINALAIHGNRFDTGNRQGWLAANNYLAEQQ